MASLHFCTECNNLLYPRADPRGGLVYACRICSCDETPENLCVYRNDLVTVTREQAGETLDLGHDPTLPHSSMHCPKCNIEQDCVFYQDQSKRKETRMILFYVCCKCGTNFQDLSLKEHAGPQSFAARG